MNEQLEDRLRDHLLDRAQRIAVPDEPFVASRRQRVRRLVPALAAAAAVVVLVGGFAFLVGRETAPDGRPTATEPPATTTATPSEPTAAPAPPAIGTTFLEWVQIDSIDDIAWVADVVAYDGGYLLLGGQVTDDTMAPPPAALYFSTDGRTWEAFGRAPDLGDRFGGLHILGVGPGAIALGGAESAEGAVPTGDGFPRNLQMLPVVHLTGDGQAWERIELPIDRTEVSNYITAQSQVQAIAVGEQGIVAFGSTFFEPDFEAILRDRLGIDLDSLRFGGWGFDGRTIEVLGPGSVVIERIELADLGITDASMFFGEEQMHVWRSTDFATFELIEPEGIRPETYIEHAGVLPDGRFYFTGQGPQGASAWASSDGAVWEQVARGGHEMQTVTPFGEGWLAAIGDTAGGVVFSPDGETWPRTNPGLFPDDGRMWHTTAVKTGGLGVVAGAVGFTEPDEFDEPPPILIERGGYEIEISQSRGTVTVRRDGETLLSASGGVDAGAMKLNPDGTGYLFVDPETGEELVALSFEDLEQAEMETYSSFRPGDEANGILFSPDGLEWSFQPAATAFGTDAALAGINVVVVGPDFVLAQAWPLAEEADPNSPDVEVPPAQFWIGTLR